MIKALFDEGIWCEASERNFWKTNELNLMRVISECLESYLKAG